jgi:hypothetical protein
MANYYSYALYVRQAIIECANAKRVTFPEDRLYSDLQNWADIKRFLPGALIG